MGRIADAALARLTAGPAALDDLAAGLVADGVTRARDPTGAVRRALRGDPRVIALADGCLASVDQVFNGLVLTARVSVAEHDRGAVDLDGDLAPLVLLGLTRAVLPLEIHPGEHIAVRVVDASAGRVIVDRAPSTLGPSDAEGALVAHLRARLTHALPGGADPRRAGLAAAVAEVAATVPEAFRRPGRPLSDGLGEAGFEIHLGWVAPAGTRWGALTELEIEVLEHGVADHLAADRPLEAAELQDRLVGLLRRHLPERVPAARRRLARVLARAGRTHDGLAILTGAFGFDDPEDRYEACLLAIRLGDTVRARRWAEEGLARSDGPGHADVAACLEDLAGDLDAQATYRAAQEQIADHAPPPGTMARLLVSPRRSYLVGALVEQTFGALDAEAAHALVVELGTLGATGRDACLACAEVMEPPLADAARRTAGEGRVADRPWVGGLANAAPIDAWTTASGDAAGQQHLIIALAKEDGRRAPLIVVIDDADLGGAVRDAFFLNDLAEARFRRELLRPISELGVTPRALPVDEALAALDDALERTAARGWHLPALEYQPVLTRIHRWVLPERGAPARPASPDSES
jgi:hypothetical protein